MRRALSDPRARAVATSLHDLAKEIGIAAIAEGVEEAASAEMRAPPVFVTPGAPWQPALPPERFVTLLLDTLPAPAAARSRVDLVLLGER